MARVRVRVKVRVRVRVRVRIRSAARVRRWRALAIAPKGGYVSCHERAGSWVASCAKAARS